MPQETQVRQILIKVDTQGDKQLRDISKQLSQVSKDVSTLAGLGSLLQNALSFSFLGLGISQLTGIIDSLQLTGDRIKVITGSAEDAKSVMADLAKVANTTKTSIVELANVYSRLAVSLKDTKLSAGAVLNLTELLQNSFRLSGSTTQEAAGAIIQLSQAFTSGQLRGQELRSVMTQNAYVARLLTKEFGSEESVYKQAERGLISLSRVLKLLFKNQEEINTQAKELGQTFGQTLAVAANNFQKALHDLNTEFKLTAKFAEGVAFVMDRLTLIIAGAALYYLPTLAIKLASVGSVLLAAATPFGVWIAALLAIGAGILYTVKNLDDFVNKLTQTVGALLNIGAAILDLIRTVGYFVPGINLLILAFENLDNFSIAQSMRDYAKASNDAIAENIKLEKTIADIQKISEKEHKTLEDIDTLNKLNKIVDKRDAKGDLAALNTEYLKGKINIDQYYAAIRQIDQKRINEDFKKGKDQLEKYRLEQEKIDTVELNRKLNTGRIGIIAYNEALDKINLEKLTFEFQSSKISLSEFNLELLKLSEAKLGRSFKDGLIGIDEFNQKVEDNKLAELKLKLDAGKISWKEYRKEVDAVSTSLDSNGLIVRGTERYLDSIGSKANQIADAIKSAFTSLEDALLEFINTGTLDFKKFAQDILNEINKIIIRASIIGPIARGINGYFQPGQQPTDVSGNFGSTGPAGGATFISQKVAGGFGNTTTPTPIYGANGEIINNNTSGGVVINITNNSNSEITQQESQGPGGEKVIDLIIQSKVKDGIASGSFDSVFGASYGLKRRGS